MQERLKRIREHFEMTQSDFAKKLGVGQSTLAMMEVSKRDISDRHIKTICAICNVSEDWLRTGNGEMFVESDETIIDEVAAQYGLGGLDKQMLKIFLELSEEKRERFKRFAYDLVDAVLSNDLLRTEFQNQYMDSDALLLVNDSGAEAAKIPEPMETGADEVRVFRAASSDTSHKPEIVNQTKDKLSALKSAPKVTSDDEL